MPEHPEAIVAGKKRPFTGAEFLESLRDGREVYIYGEWVKDVTTHPAFRNSAASVALLYDALHAKETKDVLTGPTDTGSGGYTHKFFKVAHSRDDVIAQRDAIAAWARITYGWLGRSPDYKAAFIKMNYSGSHELIRVFQLQQAQGNGVLKAMEALAEQCMADYDENGWTHPAFTNPTDISVLGK